MISFYTAHITALHVQEPVLGCLMFDIFQRFKNSNIFRSPPLVFLACALYVAAHTAYESSGFPSITCCFFQHSMQQVLHDVAIFDTDTMCHIFLPYVHILFYSLCVGT